MESSERRFLLLKVRDGAPPMLPQGKPLSGLYADAPGGRKGFKVRVRREGART